MSATHRGQTMSEFSAKKATVWVEYGNQQWQAWQRFYRQHKRPLPCTICQHSGSPKRGWFFHSAMPDGLLPVQWRCSAAPESMPERIVSRLEGDPRFHPIRDAAYRELEAVDPSLKHRELTNSENLWLHNTAESRLMAERRAAAGFSTGLDLSGLETAIKRLRIARQSAAMRDSAYRAGAPE